MRCWPVIILGHIADRPRGRRVGQIENAARVQVCRAVHQSVVALHRASVEATLGTGNNTPGFNSNSVGR